MPLSVFNVLHPPLGAQQWRTHRPPGLLTLTATTSRPQIVHNAAPYSSPVTTHVSSLSKKGAGRNPEGPEPSLVTPPRPRRPSTNCKLLWWLLTGCKLAQTQSKMQPKKKRKKENTNITQHKRRDAEEDASWLAVIFVQHRGILNLDNNTVKPEMLTYSCERLFLHLCNEIIYQSRFTNWDSHTACPSEMEKSGVDRLFCYDKEE